MYEIIRDVINGKRPSSSIDEYFGTDYNEQNERMKRVIKLLILNIRNYKISNIEEALQKFDNGIKDKNSKLLSYVLGADVEENLLNSEILLIVGVYTSVNTDGIEELFAVEQGEEKSISYESSSDNEINSFKIKEYMEFPELLEKDVNFGLITPEQVAEIRKKISENQGSERGKQYIKGNGHFKENIELGFIEPLLLSLVVSAVGLIYVGYLYLII